MDVVGEKETENRNMCISTSMHTRRGEGNRESEHEYASRMEREESSGSLKTELLFWTTPVLILEVFMCLDEDHSYEPG